MLSIGEFADWLFGLWFAASIGVALFSLERMRMNVNLLIGTGEGITITKFLGRALRQPFTWENTIVGYSLEILDQHRRYRPLSRLPILFAVCSRELNSELHFLRRRRRASTLDINWSC